MNPEIISIGFEGQHRSGKETQIETLKEKLGEKGIPVIVVKGDGRKPEKDDYPIKLDQEKWDELTQKMSLPESEGIDWDKAAYRLAREYIVARDRLLPKVVREQGAPAGVIILDRSVLSRGAVAEGKREDMYKEGATTKGRQIRVEDVVPNLIINIQVPVAELKSRIATNDPRADEKLRHIEQSEKKYNREFYSQFLTEEEMSRVVDVSGVGTAEEVGKHIHNVLQQRYPQLFEKE